MALALSVCLRAEPVSFDIPAQQADEAILSLARRANVEVIFSFDALHAKMASPVQGRMEPEDALRALLKGTGFTARGNGKGRLVVVALKTPTGSVRGRVVTPRGVPAAAIRILAGGTRSAVTTDAAGGFYLASLPEGSYQLLVTGGGYMPLIVEDVQITAESVLTLDTLTLQPPSSSPTMEPFVVEARTAVPGPLGDSGAPPAPRSAAGDIDLPRTEDDALGFEVFSREQIARSGAIDLNRFLQRELLNGDATTLPPEQNATAALYASGSPNLSLGGFLPTDQATVVLVNGRRLPEIVTALPADPGAQQVPPPQADVNVVPLDLIERIEVLPVSASALYNGSPVGGVINIVLRPVVNTTELTVNYTNALDGFGSPQSTLSLLHGETLLDGRLQVRLNAAFTQIEPPTEAQLGYVRTHLAENPQAQADLFRATANVSSADGTPLFGPGTPSFTSVAPGSDGSGGLAPFAARQGVQSLGLYVPPGGGLADSPNSLNYPYGRREHSMSLFGSVTYDPVPWLELGVDATASRTVNNTGYSVLAGSLQLAASSPLNPFGKAVDVTLNDVPLALGANYNEARIDYYSAVLGLLVRGPRGWQLSADSQVGVSLTSFRGINGADSARWQGLVNQGLYNPLRDTQVYGPPESFYDQVLVFYGHRGEFATLGDYRTLDGALRLANPSLQLPTGPSSVTVGVDYQYASLASYTERLLYGDGSAAQTPTEWVGRSLIRYSGFGEAQVPLLPARWLPGGILKVEADLSARYTPSDLANESNLAPTAAVKVDLAGGLSLRGTYATSNRFPPDAFSHGVELSAGGITGGEGPTSSVVIRDPLRGGEEETAQETVVANPNLRPEAAVTRTLGVVYRVGKEHRFRASLDYDQTEISGEIVGLNAQQLVDLQSLFPERVIRQAPAPGDPFGVGRVATVYTGDFNTAFRHSADWNFSADYAWTRCLGGTLEANCRWVLYRAYQLELLPGSTPVDELHDPDGSIPGLVPQRMNLGVNWSGKTLGFGVDGHYFHSQELPQLNWADQGGTTVAAYWQIDGFVEADLARLLHLAPARYGIRGQLRVDNVLRASPPRFSDDPSGAGVQEYGDWRGRVVSASVSVTF